MTNCTDSSEVGFPSWVTQSVIYVKRVPLQDCQIRLRLPRFSCLHNLSHKLLRYCQIFFHHHMLMELEGDCVDPANIPDIDGWVAIGAFAWFCSAKTSQTGGRHASRDFDPFSTCYLLACCCCCCCCSMTFAQSHFLIVDTNQKTKSVLKEKHLLHELVEARDCLKRAQLALARLTLHESILCAMLMFYLCLYF